MKVGDQIRTKGTISGMDTVHRIVKIIDEHTVEVEPVSVGGYVAIGLPVKIRVTR